MTVKRLFFGLEANTLWPDKLPKGRLIAPEHRHMTTSFLGETPYGKLQEILAYLPKPEFKVGLAGFFDKCLILKRVAAWHVCFLDNRLQTYVDQFNDWLKVHGFSPKHADKPLLPHVTLCRHPFYPPDWEKAFVKQAVTFSRLHLYESLGYSKYSSLWHFDLEQPISNTYEIRGENLRELYHNSIIALAFSSPKLLDSVEENVTFSSLDDVWNALATKNNNQVAKLKLHLIKKD